LEVVVFDKIRLDDQNFFFNILHILPCWIVDGAFLWQAAGGRAEKDWVHSTYIYIWTIALREGPHKAKHSFIAAAAVRWVGSGFIQTYLGYSYIPT
jgi:hypothetical protein